MTREAHAPLTLGELASLADGRLEGDAELPVSGIAPLEDAGPRDAGFLSSRRYLRFLPASRAGSFLVSQAMEGHVAGRPRVVVADPHRALVLALRRLHPPTALPPGVHPTAVLGEGVRLGRDVRVAPYAVLEDGVDVGEGSSIGAHAVVGRGALLGRECTLHPLVVLYPGTRLGHRVIVHSGTVVGADGFGYAFFDGAHQRIPHQGTVVLGDDVEIGANATVDRGSIGDTVLEEGVKVDNLVQIGHNVHVGAHSLLAGMVGLAGSARLGRGVWMAGQSGVVNHAELGDGARVAAGTKVLKDVPPGQTVSGYPSRPHREELRRQALLTRLPAMEARLAALEAELRSLRSPGTP